MQVFLSSLDFYQIVPKNLVCRSIKKTNEKNIPKTQNMSNDVFWALFFTIPPSSPLRVCYHDMDVAGCGWSHRPLLWLEWLPCCVSVVLLLLL
jgi:hypothetical protein